MKTDALSWQMKGREPGTKEAPKHRTSFELENQR